MDTNNMQLNRNDYRQPYANKLKNQEEMDRFVDTIWIMRTENLNRLITMMEIKSVGRMLQTKKCPVSDSLQNSTKFSKKMIKIT